MTRQPRPNLDQPLALPPVTAALVFLVAMNLRPALTSVGPLLGEIGVATQLSESWLGLLGAMPLLAFAAFSPLITAPARRFEMERTLLAALLLLVVGSGLRSYAGGGGLWLGTLLLGAAIAAGNVLVPTLVKRDYSRHISLATGVYSACIIISAAISAAVAVPLADALGWRASLAVWALPALLTAVVWLPRTRAAGRPAPARRSAGAGSVWRSREAWQLTAFLGLQSIAFYVMATWLPTIIVAQGASARWGGLSLFIFQLASLPAALLIPRLLKPGTSHVTATVVSSIPMAVGVFGLLLQPALSILWAVVAGAGSGAALVVALSLISLRGRTQEETTRLSGMAQSMGYLFAAAGPVLVGALVERTGTWSASLAVMGALALAQIAAGIFAGRPAPR
ncbi:MFS transporter [Buchananella felis]|uniref:MFS transporter n=1 Tax=Buchananella felis TaxID=3231492 RepID=UPI003528B6E3